MSYYFTPYLIPLLIAALIPAALAVYAWRYRQTTGARPFIALMLALCEWALFYVLEIHGQDLATKVFWAKLEYFGIGFLSLSIFIFALEYTGRAKWITARTITLLAIEPILTIVLVLTNEQHHLIWTGMKLISQGPFLLVDFSHGLWFWVHIGSSYIFLILTSILIVQALRRQTGLYRGQIVGMLIGLGAPWVGNFISNFGFLPVAIDLTPLAFTVTGVAMAWSLFRYRLLDLTPIARERVVESMSDGMIVIDMQGRIVDVNPAAQEIIGMPSSVAFGKNILELLQPRPDLVDQYRDVFEARDEITVGEGAERKFYELHLSALKDTQAKVVGRVITLRDVTDRKHVELQLSAARDQALEASRLKSEILAHVSHELRTPLGAIMGYAELIQEENFGAIGPESKKALDEIIDSTHDLTRLVGELLDEAQLEEQRVILKIRPFDTQDLLRHVYERMVVLAQSKGLEFTTTQEPNVPQDILGDEARLRQILVNLIANAIKFTERGGVRVRLYLPDNSHWAMQVSDTGSGIPLEAQHYIFDPFRQVDGSITREQGGTGLGLAIVKNMTELMGGTIRLESEVEKGSTFTILLPLVFATEASP